MSNAYTEDTDVVNELQLKLGSVIPGTTIDMPFNKPLDSYMANVHAMATVKEAKELLIIFKKAELYDLAEQLDTDSVESIAKTSIQAVKIAEEIKELQS